MCSPNSLPKNFKIPSKLKKYLLQNETLKIRKHLKLSEKNQEKKKKKQKGSSKNEKINCFNYEKVRHMLVVLITKISKRLRKQLGMIVSPITVSLRTPIRVKMILLCCICEKSLFKN